MAKQKSAYAQKLLDPRWQRLRLEILNRDEWACQHCGNKEATLHVHHTYYEFRNDPWEYPTESLVSYCEGCHSLAEQTRAELRELIPTFSLNSQLSLRSILDYLVNIDSDIANEMLSNVEDLALETFREAQSNGKYKAQLGITNIQR